MLLKIFRDMLTVVKALRSACAPLKSDVSLVQGVDMKYIDPSYQIRAVPTNCNDRIYCKVRSHALCGQHIPASLPGTHKQWDGLGAVQAYFDLAECSAMMRLLSGLKSEVLPGTCCKVL